jgi:hypothetical protein
MSPPTVTTKYFDRIILSWPIVTDFQATGRTPVTEYKIYWDAYMDHNSINIASVPWVLIGTVT